MRRMPLRLDIVRHGHALAKSLLGDAGRELSPEGIEAVRALAAELHREGWRPEQVFASPLTRARQTMTVLLEPVGTPIPVRTLRELMPEGNVDALVGILAGETAGCSHALVVGHQPLLGTLIAKLTGETPSVAPGSLHVLELPEGLRARAGRIVSRR
jgi:phosphohistidine phosphatase